MPAHFEYHKEPGCTRRPVIMSYTVGTRLDSFEGSHELVDTLRKARKRGRRGKEEGKGEKMVTQKGMGRGRKEKEEGREGGNGEKGERGKRKGERREGGRERGRERGKGGNEGKREGEKKGERQEERMGKGREREREVRLSRQEPERHTQVWQPACCTH